MKTIKLLGLEWLTENTLIDGVELNAHTDELLEKLDSLGLRLPTLDEHGALASLPNRWDDALKGMWFAESDKYFGDASKTLFLPASGFRYSGNGLFYYQGAHGYYWSTSVIGTTAYYLTFYSSNMYPANSNNRANGFSLRCVKKS
jgi:uncharacterized protein (TIGR02145 family)